MPLKKKYIRNRAVGSGRITSSKESINRKEITRQAAAISTSHRIVQEFKRQVKYETSRPEDEAGEPRVCVCVCVCEINKLDSRRLS